MSVTIRVWDPVIRLFHWLLVAAFLANAFLTPPGKALHQWLGYAVAGLIVLRLVWGVIGTRHARLSGLLPRPSAILGQVRDIATGRRRRHAGHSPLGALMIWNLLLTMGGLAFSGHAMTTLSFFGVEWVEEVHEALVVWAEISVLVHVLAVLLESRRLGVNLPKSMITGYKTLP